MDSKWPVWPSQASAPQATHRWAERLSKVMKYLHREFYRLKTFFPLK
jgi:hypothetical protein